MQGLNRRKDVFPSLRPRSPDIELAKSRVCQDLSVRSQRLLQDLLPMRDEQQRGSFWIVRIAEASIVQGSDNGLSGAGGCDDEVAVPVMHGPLRRQGLQHLLLIVVRADFQAGERNGWTAGPRLTGCLDQGLSLIHISEPTR